MPHLASDYKYKIWGGKVRLTKEMAILDAELDDTNGKVVLDGGCSDGKYYFPEYLARGLKVIGCDINAKNLSAASKNLNPELVKAMGP